MFILKTIQRSRGRQLVFPGVALFILCHGLCGFRDQLRFFRFLKLNRPANGIAKPAPQRMISLRSNCNEAKPGLPRRYQIIYSASEICGKLMQSKNYENKSKENTK
jgi:hypothetical protein